MQVVIDISEKDYQTLKKKEEFDAMYLNYYEKLIVYGTPLPKGHGKLIDTSELLTVTDIREDGSEVTYVLYNDIENANTIIEADVPKR
jgi:hypothetical protein